MESYASTQKSTAGLIRRLAEDAKTAIRKEIELAKAELSEQVAKYGRHTAWLAAGVSIAYGGIIILFMCLGILFAWLLIRVGIEEILAIFAGLGIMAVLCIATGVVALLVSLKRLKTLSPVPTKAVHEAKQLTSEITGKEPSVSLPTHVPKAERGSTEIQAELEAIHHTIGDNIDELKDHLSLRSLTKEATQQMKLHPVPTALLGTGAAFVGFRIVQKARRRSHQRTLNALAVEKQADKTTGLLGKLLTIINALQLLDRVRSAFSTYHQNLREKYPHAEKPWR